MVAAVSCRDPMDERHPQVVDDVVGDLAADELAAQRVLREQVAEALHHRRPGSTDVSAGCMAGSSGSWPASSSPASHRLSPAISTASSGRVSPAPAARRASRSAASGRARTTGSSAPFSSSASRTALEPVGSLRAARPGRSRAARTAAGCPPGRRPRPPSAPRGPLRRPPRGMSSPRVTAQARQHLEVDLPVGGVDAGGVVDRVGVDRARPAAAYSMRARCGEREVGALADDPRPQRRGRDPELAVGPIVHRAVVLGARPHERPDPAGEQQVDRRLEDRPDQLGRRQLRSPTTRRTHASGGSARSTSRPGRRRRRPG